MICSGGRLPQPHESNLVTTEDAGHQVKETKREEQVESEPVIQYLCKLRGRMVSGGEQSGKYVEFVVLKQLERSDDTFKCVVQSAVTLCETSLLFELASQWALYVTGEVRSTATDETLVNEKRRKRHEPK